MAHALPDQAPPTWRERIVSAWGGRAVIRRNLTIAITDAIGLTIALQAALHAAGVDLPVSWSSAFSTGTRILTGVGIWLGSRIWLKITGELPEDDSEDDSEGVANVAAAKFRIFRRNG